MSILAKTGSNQRIRLMYQEGVTSLEAQAAEAGINSFLFEADLTFQIKIERLGVFRNKGYIEDIHGTLVPHESVDYYVDVGRDASIVESYLNGQAMVNALAEHPDRKGGLCWDVVVVREPMHWTSTSTRSIIGLGPRHGALITVAYHRLVSRNDEELGRRIKLLLMHELGHALGLFLGPFSDTMTDKQIQALHCQNLCVMRSGGPERLNALIIRPFCHSCRALLRVNCSAYTKK